MLTQFFVSCLVLFFVASHLILGVSVFVGSRCCRASLTEGDGVPIFSTWMLVLFVSFGPFLMQGEGK